MHVFPSYCSFCIFRVFKDGIKSKIEHCCCRKLEREQKLNEAGGAASLRFSVLSLQFTRGQNAEKLFLRG